MSQSQRLAIAAHLHVILRRKLGRVTDTEWMASNADYAREIVRLCRAEDDAELREWADKPDAAIKPLLPKPAAAAPAASRKASEDWAESTLPIQTAPLLAEPRVQEVTQRYIGRLR